MACEGELFKNEVSLIQFHSATLNVWVRTYVCGTPLCLRVRFNFNPLQIRVRVESSMVCISAFISGGWLHGMV